MLRRNLCFELYEQALTGGVTNVVFLLATIAAIYVVRVLARRSSRCADMLTDLGWAGQ